MKKITLTLATFLTLTFLFYSCQKEQKEISVKSTSDGITSKINSWLDSQKPTTQPNKSANIELLKENLDFSGLQYENFIHDAKFIIIPVKEHFKTLKNIDNSYIPVLLLVINKSGNITRGNVVLYIPEAGQQISRIPANTFYKMYNIKPLDCNGMFRFLSVTGKWLYQWEYKDGKPYSFGSVQTKEKQNSLNNGTGRTTEICYDWYLHTQTYQHGILIDETWEYLGTTCGSDCDNPQFQSLCNDYTGGGGGGGGEPGYDENCDYALTQFSNSEVASETVNIETASEDQTTRTKYYHWTIFKSTLNFWHFNSHETGVHIKVGSEWQWQSFTHNTVSLEGTVAGGNVECTSSYGAETLGTYWSAMTIFYTIKFSLVCRGFPVSHNQDFTSTKYFNVND